MNVIANNSPVKFGHIETSYKQSDMIKSVHKEYGFESKGTNGGVCMAMSAEYLTKSFQGEDFYAWLSNSESKWQVLSAYLDSNYQALSPLDYEKRIQDQLNTHFEHVGTLNVDNEDFVPEYVAQAMSMASDDTKKTFNMCYLVSPEGPCHAVACIKDSQDHIHFMDPNIGELSFSSTVEFENWMSNTFHKLYPMYNQVVVNLYEAPSSHEFQNDEKPFQNFV